MKLNLFKGLFIYVFSGESCGFSWTVWGVCVSENSNESQRNTTSPLTLLDVDQGLELKTHLKPMKSSDY